MISLSILDIVCLVFGYRYYKWKQIEENELGDDKGGKLIPLDNNSNNSNYPNNNDGDNNHAEGYVFPGSW